MPYKVKEKHILTLHEKREIMAICGDFKKRAMELARGARRPEVLERYLRLNTAITEALDEICVGESEKVKLLFLSALAERRGHNWSPLCMMMSPTAFYERKSRIMCRIAEKLNII
ncbi:MAG: hypothetical protein IJW46_07080 [Clostridia bacterium]|nr:hypothetical protein [Clostridia bacterium]